MKRVSLITFIICIHLYVFSQDKTCGTKDIVESNFSQQAFDQFLMNDNSLRSEPDILLPLSIHIIQHEFGFGGLNTTTLFNAVDTMNAQYAFMDIEFFICGDIEYINDTELWDFNDNEENQLSPYLVPNTINVFFVRTLETSSGDPLCGYAYFPWAGDLVMMQNGCTADGATFAHELGHYLGLYHTHAFGELVDRSNCSFAGDRCCDTPADPYLGSDNVDFNCNYTGTETDANGDFYTPMVSNLMSYAPSECAYEFTDDQKSRVRYYATTSRDYLMCSAAASLNENQFENIAIYPNPASNQLTVEAKESIEFIAIYDVSQKQVLYQESKGGVNENISLDSLVEGVYIIHVFYKSGGFSRMKFIKQ